MATSTNQIRCLVYNEAVRGSFHMVDLHSTFLLIRSLRCLLRADVSKYRPEVYRSENSKILKKIHKVALGKLLT